MANLREIRGMTRLCVRRLADAGIRTTEQLLENGASRAGRMRLADLTNLSEDELLAWVQRADLMRVPRLNQHISDIIIRAGIVSPQDLALYNSRRLLIRLARHAAKGRILRTLPTPYEIEQYIRDAKRLPRYVSY